MPESTLRLEWVATPGGELQTAEANSSDELADQLESLSTEALANPPFMVDLISEDGSSLSIGLGRGISVAAFSSAEGNPPYYVSLGSFTDMPETIVYYGGGQWTEFPGVSAVPLDDALDATRRFQATGRLPDNLKWRET